MLIRRRQQWLSRAFFGIGAAALVSGCAPQEPPRSVIEIAPGVVAIESHRRPIPAANQAWIELHDSVVVFDPGFPDEARELLDRIRSATDKPVSHVVLSHFHGDHCDGATVFAALGAELVAAEAGRKNYEGWAVSEFANSLKIERPGYAGLNWAPPTLYFDTRVDLADGKRRVEILHLGHGHTPGDVVVWLPEERVLFTGDLYDNGAFNNLANADIDHWVVILDQLIAMSPKRVVPGHGPVSGLEELVLQRRYLAELRDRVPAAVAAKQDPQDFRKNLDLPFFEEWTGVSATEREYDVLYAFTKYGAQVAFPQPMSPRRKVAIGAGIGLGFAMLVFGGMRWYRR